MGLRRDKVAVSRLAAGLPLIVGAGFIPPAGVCAAAGCGGVRAPRPTNARVVATVRFGLSFRKVCRGGIYPSRKPRAAANTRGRAMALPYKPPAGARQNFCAAPKIRTEQAPLSKGARAEIGGLPPGKLPPPRWGPAKTRAPFRQRHFAAKQSLRPRFARPPPFDKGG